MQIIKVIEKPEWPKYYVNVKNGARVRVFSKADVPRKGYVPESELEAYRTAEAAKVAGLDQPKKAAAKA